MWDEPIFWHDRNKMKKNKQKQLKLHGSTRHHQLGSIMGFSALLISEASENHPIYFNMFLFILFYSKLTFAHLLQGYMRVDVI